MPKYGAKKKKEKKIGENNGQLRFVRHQGWRTQERLDQKSVTTMASFASKEGAWTMSAGWYAGRLVCWSFGMPVGWYLHMSVGMSVGWYVGRFVIRSVGMSVGW